MQIEDLLTNVLNYWNLEFKMVHPETKIHGSSERTITRMAVEDYHNKFYVLEKISPRSYPKKEKIIGYLESLSKKGQDKVPKYHKSFEGKYVVYFNGEYWMIRDYVNGQELPRPQFVYDYWRGNVLAHYLVDLRNASEEIKPDEDKFSLVDFIKRHIEHLQRNSFKMEDKLNRSYKYLEGNFFKIYDQIPETFCHGDFHPLNVIWGKNDIVSVIDWEFCGYLPECYDVANLIGCVGMENPKALLSELVLEFVDCLRSQDFLSDDDWEYVVDFILALRFAWLNEWIRKKDHVMVNLELTYMNVLIDNKSMILNDWLKF